MKRRFCTALTVIAVGIFPLCAITAEKLPGTIFAFEDSSCGAWARSSEDKFTRETYLFWLRGFVSGYNYESETWQVPFHSMPDNDTLTIFVDKSCREHPLWPFFEAAFELIKEIRIKK